MVYPRITNLMLKDLIPNQKLQGIIIAGCAVLALYLIRMFLRYFVQYYGHMIGVGMQAQMRRDLFAHLQKLPFQYYDSRPQGKILVRVINYVSAVSDFLTTGLITFIVEGFSIPSCFIAISASSNICLTNN